MDPIEFLEQANSKIIKYASSLQFDKYNPQHLISIALYGSIIELNSTCLNLIKNEMPIGVPILFKTILEAHVDLTNLCNDASYIGYLNASNLKEWIRVLKEADSEDNPYLASIT